jgi:hypothetical protein
MAQNNGNRQNQLLFREVNKRIREVTEGWGPEGGIEFLCECGREDCTATFELTPAQFDRLLRDDGRFLIAHECQSLNAQHAVAEYGDYLVLTARAAVKGADG